jgi:predicted O-methyltransferase YrrM
MTPMKLDVFFAMYAFGGNGSVGMQLPEITLWYAKTIAEMSKDSRIGRIEVKRFGDIPLTMERNRSVRVAKDMGCDVIIMVDSDNVPDLYLGVKEWAKPFWQTSFDFLYERKLKGLPTVVAAPYCGPPPHPTKGGFENVYVFHGEADESDNDRHRITFQAYSREHAAQMRGIQSIAAGPTGCIMYSTDAFDLMPVHQKNQEQILTEFKEGKLTLDRAKRLLNLQSWFFYEYTDAEQTQKASTEDVTNTREIQLAGLVKHRQPVVFCNWDAWAGHYKPKCVGMPEQIYVEHINEHYLEAVEQCKSIGDEMREIDYTDALQDTHQYPALQEDEELPADIQQILDDVNKEQAEPSEEISDPSPEKKFEFPIIKRMIGGRPVKSIGNMTPPLDLNALTEIVALVAESRPKMPLRIVEVGSWVGESTIALHNGLGKAGGTIWCVDTWEGTPTDSTGSWAEQYGYDKLFETFRDNIGDLLDEDVKVLKGLSVDVANSMEPQEVDIVFLDAGHDYDAITADLRAWIPHVAKNGVLCGHDYCMEFPGVVQAVTEFCAEAGMSPQVVNGSCVWMFLMHDFLAGKKAMEKKKKKRLKAKEDNDDVSAAVESDA